MFYRPQKALTFLQALARSHLNEIRIVGDIQHAHLLGVGMKTRHFRNGVELEPLDNDPNYDFNFQNMRLLKKERVVKPVNIKILYNGFYSFNSFFLEFLKWTFPSLNLYKSIVANMGKSIKSITEWQTV